jgi:hypothetical protein
MRTKLDGGRAAVAVLSASKKSYPRFNVSCLSHFVGSTV